MTKGQTSSAGRPADKRRVAHDLQRQRRQRLVVLGALVAVVALIVVFIAVRATSNGAKSNTAVATETPSALNSYTSAVSLQTMRDAADNYKLTAAGGAYPQVTSYPPTTAGGKPGLLYVGAEYCPFCATERWPLVLALSKFGTFHNLSSIHSASTTPSGQPEAYPNTATFSFYKSTYTSPYLSFTPVEEQGINYKPLQTPTASENTLMSKYDVDPATGQTGSIPFIYFNGKGIISGAEYNPQLLAGKSFQQISNLISSGTTPLASSVIADAGVITSMICRMTNGSPSNVCRLFPKPIDS